MQIHFLWEHFLVAHSVRRVLTIHCVKLYDDLVSCIERYGKYKIHTSSNSKNKTNTVCSNGSNGSSYGDSNSNSGLTGIILHGCNNMPTHICDKLLRLRDTYDLPLYFSIGSIKLNQLSRGVSDAMRCLYSALGSGLGTGLGLDQLNSTYKPASTSASVPTPTPMPIPIPVNIVELCGAVESVLGVELCKLKEYKLLTRVNGNRSKSSGNYSSNSGSNSSNGNPISKSQSRLATTTNITANITTNANIDRDNVRRIPIECLLIETDSPDQYVSYVDSGSSSGSSSSNNSGSSGISSNPNPLSISNNCIVNYNHNHNHNRNQPIFVMATYIVCSIIYHIPIHEFIDIVYYNNKKCFSL